MKSIAAISSDALPNELVQIPAPFNDLAGRWKNSNETERIDSIERQSK